MYIFTGPLELGPAPSRQILEEIAKPSPFKSLWIFSNLPATLIYYKKTAYFWL
jgi:hypothetical protein